jgi:ArsR family transcriptional regulator, arsenate/arsenite/antimonite-responsive transcriptional repressor / arsenate reductase (thioredoxin)
MDENQAPSIFKLLSNDLRWNILKALSQSDLRVQELTELLGQPQNLVSYHLQKLHEAGLVIEHQSIADGREIYYGMNLNQIRDLFRKTQETLHPGLTTNKDNEFKYPPLRILFLCAHNSARSQMAEGFLRSKSHHQIKAFSAGPDPLSVNPFAIQVMREFNIDIHEQQSKGQDQFLDQSFDYVITVCDRARESCPNFPGNPIKIHWSIADPTLMTGSPEAQLQTFQAAANELDGRIDFFLAGVSSQ